MSVDQTSKSISHSRESLLETLVNHRVGQPIWRVYDRLDDDEVELLVELIRAKFITAVAVEHCHTTMVEIRKRPKAS